MNNEEKYRRNMKCLDKWMVNRENNKWIAEYLEFLNIEKIGIYGYGLLGKHLVRELKDKGCKISWVMDKTARSDELCDYIARPEAENSIEDVDLAVITSLTNIEEIELFLLGIVTGQVIGLDELVDAIHIWSMKK